MVPVVPQGCQLLILFHGPVHNVIHPFLLSLLSLQMYLDFGIRVLHLQSPVQVYGLHNGVPKGLWP